MEGKTATERFYDDFILKFDVLGKILHDQGKECDNNLFKRLVQFSKIKRIQTLPCHPQSNDQTEDESKHDQYPQNISWEK